MMRTPFSEFLSDMIAAQSAQIQNQFTDGAPNPLQPDYAQLLRAAFPQQYLPIPAGQTEPKVEIKPEIEAEPLPSPSGSVDRAESPTSTTESLPKEPEILDLKRPAAIQELLMSKRARLSKTTISTKANSPSDRSSMSPPMLFPESSIIAKSEHCDDTESTSSSHTSTDVSAPISPPPLLDPMSIFWDLHRQILAQCQLKQCHARIPAPSSGAVEHPTTFPIPDSHVFTQVPSRLTLLSRVQKYDMTVGEVRRRVMGPEAFNFSALGSLLRRAKLPSKNNQLINELNRCGLSVVRGRRRASVTLFSCLTEGESIKIAHDFDFLTQTEFPVKSLAVKASNDFHSNCIAAVEAEHVQTVANERRRRLEHAREMVKEFMDLLEMDRSPVLDQNPEPIFSENIQDKLSTYSMVSHGFGVPGLKVGVKAVQNFIDLQLDTLPRDL